MGPCSFDDKPVPHGVLGDNARLDELAQVIGPPGLRSSTRAAVSAERLAANHRTGDVTVDVQVADRYAAGDELDRARVARVQAAGQRERRGVERVERRGDAR